MERTLSETGLDFSLSKYVERNHEAIINGLVYKKGVDREDAEDLVMDLYTSLLNKESCGMGFSTDKIKSFDLENYDGDIESLHKAVVLKLVKKHLANEKYNRRGLKTSGKNQKIHLVDFSLADADMDHLEGGSTVAMKKEATIARKAVVYEDVELDLVEFRVSAVHNLELLLSYEEEFLAKGVDLRLLLKNMDLFIRMVDRVKSKISYNLFANISELMNEYEDAKTALCELMELRKASIVDFDTLVNAI